MPWKVVVDSKFKNAEKIFPTQQRDVKSVIDTLSAFREVRSIVIFGSRVTCLCNPWSDLDVYIDCDFGFLRPTIKSEAPLDIWTPDMVETALLEEIMSTGVVVYEK